MSRQGDIPVYMHAFRRLEVCRMYARKPNLPPHRISPAEIRARICKTEETRLHKGDTVPDDMGVDKDACIHSTLDDHISHHRNGGGYPLLAVAAAFYRRNNVK